MLYNLETVIKHPQLVLEKIINQVNNQYGQMDIKDIHVNIEIVIPSVCINRGELSQIDNEQATLTIQAS